MFTGFVGSQLMIGADKQHFIFTPQNATEYSQISEIDKLLFAFSIQPVVTIVFLLSIVYVLTLIVFQIIECKKEKIYYIVYNIWFSYRFFFTCG